MGFPENQKLAKDINNNSNNNVAELEELLSSIISCFTEINSLLTTISEKCPTRDYVDSGDMALFDKIEWLIGAYENNTPYDA